MLTDKQLKSDWELFQQSHVARQDYLDVLRTYALIQKQGEALLNVSYAYNHYKMAISGWQAASEIDEHVRVGILPKTDMLDSLCSDTSHIFSFNSWYEYSGVKFADIAQPTDWDARRISHHITVMMDFTADLKPWVLVDTAFKMNLARLWAENQNKKLYIHCKAGRSRSIMALCVALYHYHKYVKGDPSYTVEQALELSSKKRPQSSVGTDKLALLRSACELINQFYTNRPDVTLAADRDWPENLSDPRFVYNVVVQLPRFKAMLIEMQRGVNHGENIQLLRQYVTAVIACDPNNKWWDKKGPEHTLIADFTRELWQLSPDAQNNSTTQGDAKMNYRQFLTKIDKILRETKKTAENKAIIETLENTRKISKANPQVDSNNSVDAVLAVMYDLINYRVHSLNSVLTERFYVEKISPELMSLEISDADIGFFRSECLTVLDRSLTHFSIKNSTSPQENILRAHAAFTDLSEIFILLQFDGIKEHRQLMQYHAVNMRLRPIIAEIYAFQMTTDTTTTLDTANINLRDGVKKTYLYKKFTAACFTATVVEEAKRYHNDAPERTEFLRSWQGRWNAGKLGNDTNNNAANKVKTIHVENAISTSGRLPYDDNEFLEVFEAIINFRLLCLFNKDQADKSFYRDYIGRHFTTETLHLGDTFAGETSKMQLPEIIGKALQAHCQTNKFNEPGPTYLSSFTSSKVIKDDARLAFIFTNIAAWASMLNLKVSDLIQGESASTLKEIFDLVHPNPTPELLKKYDKDIIEALGMQGETSLALVPQNDIDDNNNDDDDADNHLRMH